MFSIMMTVESTTMPKSTAPSEMRFAGVSRRRPCPQKAMSSASGMLSAVMSAARRVPEEEEEHDRDEEHPDEQVLEDRVRRELHEVAAVVVRLDVHPRRQEVVLADVVDALVDALERRRRLAAVAHEDDALDDVRRRRRARRCRGAARSRSSTSATSRDADGTSLLLGDDDVLDVVDVAG